jgi:hypothetical protein
MALGDKTKFFLGIEDDGQIRFRKTRIITDDITGEIFENHHSQVLEPGQDISSLPPRVRALCNFVWTPQIIADYQAAKAARLAAVGH